MERFVITSDTKLKDIPSSRTTDGIELFINEAIPDKVYERCLIRSNDITLGPEFPRNLLSGMIARRMKMSVNVTVMLTPGEKVVIDGNHNISCVWLTLNNESDQPIRVIVRNLPALNRLSLRNNLIVAVKHCMSLTLVDSTDPQTRLYLEGDNFLHRVKMAGQFGVIDVPPRLLDVRGLAQLPKYKMNTNVVYISAVQNPGAYLDYKRIILDGRGVDFSEMTLRGADLVVIEKQCSAIPMLADIGIVHFRDDTIRPRMENGVIISKITNYENILSCKKIIFGPVHEYGLSAPTWLAVVNECIGPQEFVKIMSLEFPVEIHIGEKTVVEVNRDEYLQIFDEFIPKGDTKSSRNV